MIVRADGAGERVLASGWEPTWSPDSERIAFSNGDDLYLVLPGGRRRRLTCAHPSTYDRVGILKYVYSSSYSHWHVMGFQRYELRRVGETRVLRRDHKSGFCLAESLGPRTWTPRERAAGTRLHRLLRARTPRSPRRLPGNLCRLTDRYPRHLHGQNVDVTGLGSGDYVLTLLTHRANRSLLFAELRYENNAASLRIRLSRRHGRPSVRVLRTCPDSDRC